MGDVSRFRRLRWREPRRLRTAWSTPRRSGLNSTWLPILALALALLLGWSIFSGQASRLLDSLAAGNATRASQTVSASFSLCRDRRGTCVVDGDTLDIAGIRYRIADIDTPEVHSPACPAEKQLADRATLRLLELVNAGPFELLPVDRDEDRYGRKLRILAREGRSLGDTLIAERLAHVWDGRKHPWC